MTWARPSTEELQRKRAQERERNLKVLARTRGRAATMGGSTTGPVAKECVLRSPAYENAVRALGFCVRCRKVCRPQFCHRDEGKGTGIKTDVREGWAGCADCHFFVGTSGALPKAERRAEDLRLGGITRHEVRARGLWPKSVPQFEETTA